MLATTFKQGYRGKCKPGNDTSPLLSLAKPNRHESLLIAFSFKLLGFVLIKSIHDSAHLQMPSANNMFNFYILMHDKPHTDAQRAFEYAQSRKDATRPDFASGKAQA